MLELTLKKRHEMMDRLGQLMYDNEEDYRKYMEEHKERFDEIEKLKDILSKEIMLDKQSDSSEKLEIKYSKGRVTWNTKWIEGFAMGHPEYNLEQYKSIGKPYVSFSLREDALNDGL